MKKILIVMPSILPIPAVYGGAVAQLIESILKENEKKKCLDISVFTNLPSKAKKATEHYPSCTFIGLKESPLFLLDKFFFRSKNIIRKLFVVRQVQRLLQKADYDAVVLENSGYLLKIFKKEILLQKYKDRIYYHLHNDVPSNIDVNILKRCILMLVSGYLKKKVDDLVGVGADMEYHVVKNGINAELFSKRLSSQQIVEMKKELGIPEESRVLIFVGRITPEKGLDKILEVLKQLNDEKVVLVVVGSSCFGLKIHSEYERKIINQCEKMKQKIYFVGFVHNTLLWKYYNMADIAVLPSIWEEPAGLTMVESAMSGTPVITTKAGGIPEYMSSPMAILLDRDKNLSQNISDNVKKILYDKRESYEVLAKVYQERFSTETMYKEFVKALE